MKPRGIRLNNPLNIRHNKNNHWLGLSAVQPDKEFDCFDQMVYGVRAAMIIIRGYIRRGYDTVDKIIGRWAPSSENPTAVYVKYVSEKANILKNDQIHFYDKDKIVAIIEAMIKFENGQAIDRSYIEDAYDLV